MNLKRLFSFVAMLLFILSVASPAAAISGSGVAQDDEPAPLWPTDGTVLFMPFVARFSTSHTLTGQVKNAEDFALAGANVGIEGGLQVQTDANGIYSLPVAEGGQTIVASKAGYVFEPGSAALNVTGDMHNLNFSAMPASAPSIAACTDMLVNSNFSNNDGWKIRDVYANNKNKSVYTTNFYYSSNRSMQNGVPIGIVNPFPKEWTTAEFYQSTTIAIPNADIVQLRMHLLPRSTDLWGYHLAEQTAMDAASGQLFPDAQEAQYGFICGDGDDTDTCNPNQGGKMLFKWYPVDSFWWLFRSYDLRAYRGDIISVLFGAANDGYNGNTALYVDDVYLRYCDY